MLIDTIGWLIVVLFLSFVATVILGVLLDWFFWGLIRYYVCRRDRIVKRLVKDGLRGTAISEHPGVRYWQRKINEA